jgi:Domain of unknown function (DUF5753)
MPSLMRAQLDRVSAVAALTNIAVGVIPLGTEVTVCCDHGFNILDERGDDKDPVVHVETLTTSVNVTGPRRHRLPEVFARLRAAAVYGDGAQRLIAEAARSL